MLEIKVTNACPENDIGYFELYGLHPLDIPADVPMIYLARDADFNYRIVQKNGINKVTVIGTRFPADYSEYARFIYGLALEVSNES